MKKKDPKARRVSRFLQPVLLGIGFVLLIVITVGTVFLVDRAARDAKRLDDVLTLEGRLSNVLLAVRRAESSQRGYLFTNDPSYLDDFYGAEPAARQLLDELRALSKNNPVWLSTVERAAQLVTAKFAEMSQTLQLNQQGRREDARKAVLGGHGRVLMDELRGVIENAVLQESQQAVAANEQSERTNRLLLYFTLSGAGLILIIGAVSVISVQRNQRQREAAQKELALTNANLERIVEHRTADLTEANEEIQRFAYIVSHDLRSPLVNIMGFTSELEALRQDLFAEVGRLSAELLALNAQVADAEAQGKLDRLGKDFDEAIAFIKTSIGNMDRLINAVLRLSREGRRQFDPQKLDMNRLMDGLVRNVAHRIEELGAAIAVGKLPAVESDRLALEQIFANLIDNALKYRRNQEPLRIEINGRANATHVFYDVKDNGRGIDPRDHTRVFELFRRSGPQDRPGEGIGLAHVKALVRRLGGNIQVASELGQGSTFTVILPQRWRAEQRSVA